jgi:uncharacterized membrane protein
MNQDNISISNILKHNTERWTGRVLRMGVWTSASLMIAGLIVASIFPSSIIQIFTNPSLSNLVLSIFSGSFDPVTLMFAGLVLLMFTPILRVLTAMIGFIIERDWRFVLVSLIVFLMLAGEIIYSMLVKG